MHRLLERALSCMQSAASGMDAQALRRHPEGKWSSAEIMEHLARTFSSTSKVLARQLEARQPVRIAATSRQRLSRLLVIELGFLPNGRAAPQFALPKGIPAEEALTQFGSKLSEMDGLITRCEREFGPRAKIGSHSIFGPLTARQWRRFHLVHTRHHARQVQHLKGA